MLSLSDFSSMHRDDFRPFPLSEHPSAVAQRLRIEDVQIDLMMGSDISINKKFGITVVEHVFSVQLYGIILSINGKYLRYLYFSILCRDTILFSKLS